MSDAAHPILPDPIAEALARAPLVRRWTDEQRVELEQDAADMEAGRLEFVEDEDLPAALEALAAERA